MATPTFISSRWVEALNNTLIYQGSSETLRFLAEASRLKAMKRVPNSTSTSTTLLQTCSIRSPTRLLTNLSTILRHFLRISSFDSRAVAVHGSVWQGRSLRRASFCYSLEGITTGSAEHGPLDNRRTPYVRHRLCAQEGDDPWLPKSVERGGPHRCCKSYRRSPQAGALGVLKAKRVCAIGLSHQWLR